jgi:hypothetical protein
MPSLPSKLPENAHLDGAALAVVSSEMKAARL